MYAHDNEPNEETEKHVNGLLLPTQIQVPWGMQCWVLCDSVHIVMTQRENANGYVHMSGPLFLF